jgi:diguanylate cyclase (GGDEF)-like protein
MATVPIVTNNIGDVFGQLVRMGSGAVWMLPSTHHNADILELLASRLQTMRGLLASDPPVGTAGRRPADASTGAAALIDALLGIPGRAQYDLDLPALCAAASSGKPLSFIMLDTDNFHEINKQCGHKGGDEILKRVAQALTDGCAGKGKVYRWGGDEFAILVPNYTLAEAEALAERLRAQVARIREPDNPPEITASIGIATFPEPVTDAKVLFDRADHAAYAAKDAGRNKVYSAAGAGFEVPAGRWAVPNVDLLTVPVVLQLKDASVAKYPFFGVDRALTIVPCPNPDRGWVLSEQQIDLKTTTVRFEFSRDLMPAYTTYKSDNYENKKFVDDKHLLMLTASPRVFTDASTLILQVKEVLFSEVLFFREVLLRADPNLLPNSLDDLISGSPIPFPHGLSMQAVVVTRDERILITKRSLRTEWYPGHWSCSVEENLSTKDFDDNRRGVDVVRHWARRGLNEELGLQDADYSTQNVRILSVFVESDLSPSTSVLNVCLCVLVRLEIGAEALALKLNTAPRKDHEFSEFHFISYDDMLGELVHPTRQYHPTSRYRMALALIQHHGESAFAKQLSSQSRAA